VDAPICQRLLEPFDADPKVGLTGSKLVNWDGSLQEAGGIFWEDGSAWNFGRGSDARAPQFSYVKDVDYCSGASIALPRGLWDALGGFDEHYLPAYCEDSDLAFRVRAAGYRSVYTPFSEVIHHEGRSHGRDTASGIKAYQVINMAKLVERWGKELGRDHYPNAVNVFRARDRSRYKKHVLIVDHYVPQWDKDAGSRSIYEVMRTLLQMDCAVTFWPDNLFNDTPYVSALQKLGVEVIHGAAFRHGFEGFLQEREGLYDAAILNRPHIAKPYFAPLRASSPQTRILYYGHDLHFMRMRRGGELIGKVDEAAIAEMRDLEFQQCAQADVVIFPDPDEVAYVQRELGGSRQYLALPVVVYDDDVTDAGHGRLAKIESEKPGALLFVGGFNHQPNRDGLLWFAQSVLPKVIQRVPGARLIVVGSKAPEEVLALDGGPITVKGYVSDEELDALYAKAGAAVAPLRYGAGVKGKVIEAMARGVPLVTTSTGAQGISGAPDALFLADNADDFADCVVRALTDRYEARVRAEQAVRCVEADFSRRVMQKQLDCALQRERALPA